MINIPIPNMLNGVSQQPPAVRSPSQGEAQENGYSSPIEGLSKRPPTEHLSRVCGNTDKFWLAGEGEIKTHLIERGDGVESYMVLLRKPVGDSDTGFVKVIDLAAGGIERTVKFSSESQVRTYLASGAAADFWSDVSLTTIGDFTFIANRNVVPAMTADVLAARNPEALFWVKTGAPHRRYFMSVTRNNTTYSDDHTPTDQKHNSTIDGTSFVDVYQYDTTAIAANLLTGLPTGNMANAGFTTTRSGYAIHVQRTSDSNTFTAATEDGLGGSGILLVKDEVEAIEDLPILAKHGMVVKVVGTPGESLDDYYVKFEATNGSFSEGVWKECAKPGIKHKLSPTTMPFMIIRYFVAGVPRFLVKAVDGSQYTDTDPDPDYVVPGSGAAWGERTVGDLDTNPDPSFVGTGIDAVFVYKNRMGFLAGEAVILSESGNYFNFFRITTSSLLDTDPIDVISSSPQVTEFRNAVPLEDRLILFSAKTQLQLRSDDVLSPKTTVLEPVSAYECQPDVQPALVGQEIFFPFSRGGQFSGIRTMLVNLQDASQVVAPDVSGHVNQYINGNVIQVGGSTHDNTLCVLSSAARTSLYVYKWFDSDSQRVQSSWSMWTFGVDSILAFAWLRSHLYVLIRRADGVMIEKVIVEPNRRDSLSDFLVLLDRRVIAVPATQSGNSTFKVPYGSVVASGGSSSTTAVDLYRTRTGEETVVGNTIGTDVVPGNQFTLGAYATSASLVNTSSIDLSTPDYVSTAVNGISTIIGFLIPPFCTLNVQLSQAVKGALIGNPAAQQAIFSTNYTSNPVTTWTTAPLQASSNFRVRVNDTVAPGTWSDTATSTQKTYSRTTAQDPLLTVNGTNVAVGYSLNVDSSQILGGFGGSVTIRNLGSPQPNYAAVTLRVFWGRQLANGINATDPLFDRSATITLTNDGSQPQIVYPWVTSGYAVAVGVGIVVDGQGNPYTISSVGSPDADGSVTVTLNGTAATGKTVYFGYPYTMRYQFSTPYLRTSEGGPPITSGRYQLHNIRVNYDRSNGFEVKVADRYGTENQYTYAVDPTLSAILVGEKLYTGSFSVPIRARNDSATVTLLNDSIYPSRFSSAEYEATYNARYGRGIRP